MTSLLPADRLERTQAWGEVTQVMDYVYRPTTALELKDVFELARRTGVSLGLRGAGRSYGDASLNSEGLLVDLCQMNRILEWDPEQGIVTAEPGVTIEQLWRHTIGDGWYPPVVPGTMFPTLGGCLAMNVHGKNNWREGPLGEHVLEFEALLPSGETVVCRPSLNEDLFYAMIGGLGVLGCFTRIRLQLKRIASGKVAVFAESSPNIRHMLERMDELKEDWEYVVGWVDGFPGGRSVGRGQIHAANHLPEGADPNPGLSLRLESQDLPGSFFGVVPKSILWRFMKPFANNLGWRMVCLARYVMAKRGHGHRFEQSLAEFNFLLDYVPDWKRAYLPDGLIQHQCLVPKATAAEAFEAVLTCCQAAGLPPYLGVAKRHRPDRFLLTHAVDGYSLALDFRVTAGRRRRLSELTHTLDQVVLEHGGRFYFAKDSMLDPETTQSYLGQAALARFFELKERCDPDNLLQTNLWRRAFAPLRTREEFHKPGGRRTESSHKAHAWQGAA